MTLIISKPCCRLKYGDPDLETVPSTNKFLYQQFKDFGKGETFHKIWYDLMFDSVFASMNLPQKPQGPGI